MLGVHLRIAREASVLRFLLEKESWICDIELYAVGDPYFIRCVSRDMFHQRRPLD